MAVTWIPAKYGSSERATLATGLTLAVVQNTGSRGGPPPKWRATVFDANLRAEFDTRQVAKAAAIRVAKSSLAKAAAALGDQEAAA